MTVNDFIAELQKIRVRDRDRELSICFTRIEDDEPISPNAISWMDCSDGILLFIEEHKDATSERGERLNGIVSAGRP